jgi:invasion protein IalB
MFLVQSAPAQQSGGTEQAAKATRPWSSRCITVARDTPFDCQLEQRAVITETGQLVFVVTIRVPADTRKPVLTIQAPWSVFLPEGLRLNVDDQNETKLVYQTCDSQGCYASTPIADDLLQAMFKGSKLNVTIQGLDRQTFTVPMSLAGFAEIYGNILPAGAPTPSEGLTPPPVGRNLGYDNR